MENASQDKREKNASYQPEMHVRNANSREIFKNNRADKSVSEKLYRYSVAGECDAGGY